MAELLVRRVVEGQFVDIKVGLFSTASVTGQFCMVRALSCSHGAVFVHNSSSVSIFLRVLTFNNTNTNVLLSVCFC